MSGIIFSACSTSWVFRCSLAAISVQFSTLKPCRRGKCKKKTWRRRTWCCEIETNDEFSVEDCRSVSNSTGFECISQPGWRSKHSVRIQTVLVRGDPLREVLNENTAWSSQLRHSDANTNTSTRRDVAEPTKKPIGTQLSHHNFEISRDNIGHLEKVYSNVRWKTESSTRRRLCLTSTSTRWCGVYFVSETMKAAEHLGQDYQENLRTTKNTDVENV